MARSVTPTDCRARFQPGIVRELVQLTVILSFWFSKKRAHHMETFRMLRNSGSGKRPLLEAVPSAQQAGSSAKGPQSVRPSFVPVEQYARTHLRFDKAHGVADLRRLRWAGLQLRSFSSWLIPFAFPSRDGLVDLRYLPATSLAGGPKEEVACCDGQRHLQHEVYWLDNDGADFRPGPIRQGDREAPWGPSLLAPGRFEPVRSRATAFSSWSVRMERE
jgi:hypothetical protein